MQGGESQILIFQTQDMTNHIFRHGSVLASKEPHSLLRCPHCKDKLRLWIGRGPDLLCSGDCGGQAEALLMEEKEEEEEKKLIRFF